MTNRKTVFSGIQPSGNLHIGNYLGAIAQWLPMQEEYDCIFSIVDYHAITVRQNPKILKNKIPEIAKIYLASGIDPKKSVIFAQSSRPEHTELAWMLNCVAKTGELSRMTQFKDKAGKDRENVSMGLYDYPVLMAADILLYQTDAVPVGEDQSQHVELTRVLARRFNKAYGETFKIPELIVKKEGMRVMALDDPTKKMSKSAKSEYNAIGLLDDPDKAAKKIIKAVTDSGSEVKYDEKNKPAVANLINIYSLLGDLPIKDIEKKYDGAGYGGFKKDLAEVVRDFLADFQEKYNNLSDAEVKKIMTEGAEKIAPAARETLKLAREKMGIGI